ncbi:hypothetical protein [Endozoicomonas sp. YOMI1]|uniref:hypothetical protein n=1 Tax=Endozoicomonas sp. YOMI1 TaxID=2828739 RepID=UPI002148AE21|nr:hypothetical protein [Endozoicomonas sp. YOMI1]
MRPKTITPVKHYCCHQYVCSITNEEGNNIIEAVKMRMHQQEEKLLSPPPRVEHLDIETALKHVPEQKNMMMARQRNASRLNIDFDRQSDAAWSERQSATGIGVAGTGPRH